MMSLTATGSIMSLAPLILLSLIAFEVDAPVAG